MDSASIGKIDQVVHVSTDVTHGCPVCRKAIGGPHEFEESVNHVLAHGWRLVHVGTESITSNDGKPFHTTVAVLGRV